MAGVFDWFKANLTPGAMGIFALLGVVVRAYFTFRPSMTRLENEREASLLEERAHEMATMRSRIEALEAERAVDRHRLNNVTQCLDALLLLLETAPEKAAAHVVRIKEMRAAQMTAEAAEKGAIRGVAIQKAEAAT